MAGDNLTDNPVSGADDSPGAAKAKLLDEANSGPANGRGEGPKAASGLGAEIKLPHAADHYEKGGTKLPLFSFKDTVPTTTSSWQEETGILKESFPISFGVKDPTKDFGGVLVSKDSSRTITRRAEAATKDGKPCKVIEIEDMKGFHGYGIAYGVKGDRKLDSVKMWQIEKGKNADGTPIYESFKEPSIYEHDWFGNPKKEPKVQPVEPMSNEEFDRRWAELDPKVLAKSAKSSTKIAERGVRPGMD